MKDLREKLKKISLLKEELKKECDEFVTLANEKEKKYSRLSYTNGIDSKLQHLLSKTIVDDAKHISLYLDSLAGSVKKTDDDLNYSHPFIRLREIHDFLLKNNFECSKVDLYKYGDYEWRYIRITVTYEPFRSFYIEMRISNESPYIKIFRYDVKYQLSVSVCEIRLNSGNYEIIPNGEEYKGENIFEEKYTSNFICNLVELLESFISRDEDEICRIVSEEFTGISKDNEFGSINSSYAISSLTKRILNNFAKKGYDE